MSHQSQDLRSKSHPARIISLGSYLPKKILTNQDLEKMVDTTDEWIVSRTGIQERRIASQEESCSVMGTLAAKQALERSHLSPQEIDLILVATMTPDFLCPSTAPLIQANLGLPKIAAIDIQAACTGFIYGLSIAKAYIESGLYRHILLIATEKMSSVINYQDRNTCILFGDGAAAAVISHQGPGLAIDTVCLGADGEVADLIKIPAGGCSQPTTHGTIEKGLHYFEMAGNEVFKHAVRRMTAASQECLEKSGLTDEQISWIVPHQANQRIIDTLAKSFRVPEDRVYRTIHKYGNTSASGVAIALDELTQTHSLNPNDHLLLVAFGAGLTWGAALLRKLGE